MNLISVLKSVSKKINAVVILSVLMIFMHDLWWASLPELFDGGSRLLTSIYNLLIGIVVSYVFYILVVKYKEFKDTQHVNRVVIPLLNSIVTNHLEINQALSKGVGEENFNGLDAEKNSMQFKNIKLYDQVASVESTFLYRPCNWITYFNYQKRFVQNRAAELIPYMAHLEPELIEIIHHYGKCSFYISLTFLEHMNESESDMSHLNKAYSEYAAIGSQLKSYLAKLPHQ